MNTQEMIDVAMEEGACTVWLWAFNKAENYGVQVTDDGFWYFIDRTEHKIDEVDARRLLDCFQVGYVD